MEDQISTFVTTNSHGFTFVLWAIILLTSKICPFENQFFCSLYILCNMGQVMVIWLYYTWSIKLNK